MALKIPAGIITTGQQLYKYIDTLDYSEPLYVDTESKDLKKGSELLGLTLYQKGGASVFVVNDTIHWDGIALWELNYILNPVFEIAEVVMQNGKYDLGVLEQNGFTLPKLIFDIIAAMHLWDSGMMKGMEYRVKVDFGYDKPKFTEILGYGAGPSAWKKIKWDTDTQKSFTYKGETKTFPHWLADYAAQDGYWTCRLHEKYAKHLEELGPRAVDIMNKIEVPLCYVLKDMYSEGVLINTEPLLEMENRCDNELYDLTEEIYKESGAVFNINSGPQLANILYKKLGYPILKKTKKGAPSTDTGTMKKLAAKGYPLAVKLDMHSKLSALLSGFIRGIPKRLYPDGKLRCNFNAAGTETGRYSSSDPNLQNQPNNEKYPVRAAFVARPGYKFAILDWSQIELRITAHYSRDARLMRAFLENKDIHQEVADAVGCTRKEGKIINFAILYGLGAESLSVLLKSTITVAQKMLDDYARAYPDVMEWKRSVEEKLKRDKYVKNMFGRRRRLPHVDISQLHYRALRQGVNHVIQGTNADMMKLAMVRAHRWIKQEKLDAHILLTVHDELVIEASDADVLKTFNGVKHIMENLVDTRVPILADGKICDNWAQMKDDSFVGYQETGVVASPVIKKRSKSILAFPTIIYN